MTYELSLDTSKTQLVTVMLIGADGSRMETQMASTLIRSQSVLPTIESLLHANHINWDQITQIQVAVGPGSFTGLRVGTIVGATLSLFQGILINGNPPGTIPQLEYGADKWNLDQ